MEAKEMNDLLNKMQRVGLGRCEGCQSQTRLADLVEFNASFICPDCLRKMAWTSDDTIELQA